MVLQGQETVVCTVPCTHAAVGVMSMKAGTLQSSDAVPSEMFVSQ